MPKIDLTIDTTDLTILGTYFGFDATADVIPEPASLSLLAPAPAPFRRKRRQVLAALRRRRGN